MFLFGYGCVPEELVTVCVSLLCLVLGRGHHSCVPLLLHIHEAFHSSYFVPLHAVYAVHIVSSLWTMAAVFTKKKRISMDT